MSYTMEAVLILLILAATWSDLRTRRIPNVVTVAGAAAGFVLHVLNGGTAGAWTSIAGALVGFALFVVFFLAGGMGAGDVKLFAAIGALLGPQSTLLVFVLTGLIGGLVAVVVARRSGWKSTLPYGPVIAAGTLLFLIAT